MQVDSHFLTSLSNIRTFFIVSGSNFLRFGASKCGPNEKNRSIGTSVLETHHQMRAEQQSIERRVTRAGRGETLRGMDAKPKPRIGQGWQQPWSSTGDSLRPGQLGQFESR